MFDPVTIDPVIAIARAAGDIVLDVYASGDFETQLKADWSTLTRADLGSNQAIVDGLSRFGIPVQSEEALVEWSVRRSWRRLWLIDPLDGRHDFVTGNAEFTVNIALVEDGRPILGVIFAPVYGELFWAERGRGAWVVKDGQSTRLPLRRTDERILIRSRFKGADAATRFADLNGIDAHATVSSALKFGRLAAGDASVYPRFEGSNEWDIAAGQILLQEAGGTILDLVTREAPRFNKQVAENNHFIACAPGVAVDSFDLEGLP